MGRATFLLNVFLVLILVLPLSYASPTLDFTVPTPLNGTATNKTSFQMNVSVNSQSLVEFRWHWNETNYSFHDDSLVLMMNLDNVSSIGEDSAHAADVSIYGNNGTISGAVWTAGKYESALSFDGLDDHVLVSNSPSLNATSNAITVEAWVNGNTMSKSGLFQAIASKWTSLTTLNTFTAYDAGNTSGLNTSGYFGAVFDGRYVYFAPYRDGSGFHGRVLRYDTLGLFNSSGSWAAYDAGSTGGLNTKGYLGAVFDGRYVYFVPYTYDGIVFHGRVLRYDTLGLFNSSGSWTAYDAVNTDNLSARGYLGGVFDGRYIYFVSYGDYYQYIGYVGESSRRVDVDAPTLVVVTHGRVLRYDTSSPFNSSGSWMAYDAGNTSNMKTKGYSGAVFDGRYIYFTPSYHDLSYHSRVLRYDTSGVFNSSSSWLAYDAVNTSSLNTIGYRGAVFDGRYVYFVPYWDGPFAHGRILRYDTRRMFNSSDSWSAYDARSTSNLSTKGYFGAVFDGRYIYFIPYSDDGPDYHGRILRYDTQGAFNSSGSWTAYDAGNTSSLTTRGYGGAAFDGRYFYAAPFYDGSDYHGKVLRYDTTGAQASYSLRYSDLGHNGGFSGSLPGTSFLVNTADRVCSVYVRNNLNNGSWNHLAGVYDGSVLKLYVNGVLTANNTANSPLSHNPTDVTLSRIASGVGYLNGTIDEVRVYNRSLSADEVRLHYYSNLKKYAPDLWEFITNQTNLSDGIYAYFGYGRENAGSENKTETRILAVDTVPPKIGFAYPTETAGRFLNRRWIAVNVTYLDTTFANITINLYNSTSRLNATTVYTKPGFVNFTSLPDGLYHFNATAFDLIGYSNSTETRNVTVDATPPIVFFVEPTPADNTNTTLTNMTANASVIDDNPANITFRLYSQNLSDDFESHANHTDGAPVWNRRWGSVEVLDGVMNLNSTPPATTNETHSALTTLVGVNLSDFVLELDSRTIEQLRSGSPNPWEVGWVLFRYVDAANFYYFTLKTNGFELGKKEGGVQTYLATGNTLNLTLGVWYRLRIEANGLNVRAYVNGSRMVDYTDTSSSLTSGSVGLYEEDSRAQFDNVRTYPLYNSKTYAGNASANNWTLLSDNRYKYEVKAADKAGNTNTTGTRSILIDANPPKIQYAAPTESGGRILNRNWVSVNVTASDVSLVNVTAYIYNSTALLDSKTTSLSPNFANFTNMSDGVYYFNATAFDLLRHSNSTLTRNVTIDTTYPAVVVYSPQNITYNTLGVLINFTAVDNALDRLWYSSGTANFTYTSAHYVNVSDGQHTFVFYANDTAGNLNTASVAFNVSTPPQISFAPPTEEDGWTLVRNNIVVNVTVFDFNLANITIFLYNLSGPVNGTTGLASPFFINFTELPNGTYYFNATAFDSAGNQNITETRTVFVNTTANDSTSPVIVVYSPMNVTYDTTHLLVDFTAFDNGFVDRLWYYNETANLTYTSAHYVNVSEGSHNFIFYANDSADNFNSKSITFNTNTPPKISFAPPTEEDGWILVRDNIAVNATAFDVSLANVTIFLYNLSGLVNETISSLSPFFVNFTGLRDGVYYFNATAVDSAGNRNSTETRGVTVNATTGNVTVGDSEPPMIIVYSPRNTTYNTTRILVDFIAFDNGFVDKMWYYDEAGNQTHTSAHYVNVSEGSHTFIFYANDSVGNLNNASVVFNINIAPWIGFVPPTDESNWILVRNNVVVNVTASDFSLTNITVFLYNTSGLMNQTSSPLGPFFVNFTGLPDGTYYFNATALDSENNSNTTETRTVVVNTTASDLSSPRVVVHSPVNITYNDTQILIDFTAFDNGFVDSLWYYNDNESLNVTYTSAHYVNVSEGSHNFIFYANDSAGNLNNTGVSFTVQKTQTIEIPLSESWNLISMPFYFE